MTREAWWSLISVGIGVLESRPAMAAVAQNGRRLAYHGRRAGRPARDFAANYRANFWLSTLVLLHDVEIAEAGHDIAVFRLFAMQLDLQAQIVERIGVAQRVLVADKASLVEIE